MDAVFLNLLNMSITASWLCLAVLLVRLLLKKAPKAISCALWALVGLRLLLPFSLESVLSLVPSAEPLPEDMLLSPAPTINSGIPIINEVVNPVISGSLAPNPGDSVNPMQVITTVAGYIWVIGMAAMLVYMIVTYLRVRGKVAEAAKIEGNVYECDHIDTPFILGVIRPRIYLPSSMSDGDRVYVIAHEKAHLRRLDHLWKPLGFLLLTVYWFNPLLWLGYILLCRDIELACDEKVIKELGTDIKKQYSEALINCSVPRRAISACPLAFGKVGVKGRIKSVLSYKKPAFWIILVAVVALVVTGVCFLTDPPTSITVKGIDDYYVWDCRAEPEIQLRKFPHVKFVYSPDSYLIKVTDKDGKSIFTAQPSHGQNSYFADLNQDGYPELCVSASWGSGIVNDLIIIYDIKNQRSYRSDERMVRDYTFAIKDDQLMVQVTDYEDYKAENPQYATPLLVKGIERDVFELKIGSQTIYKEAEVFIREISPVESKHKKAINYDALNKDTEAPALPLYKIENASAWQSFRDEFYIEDADTTYDSFDQAFFKDHVLLIAYIHAPSGDNRYKYSLVNSDDYFLLQAAVAEPGVTDDMNGWLVVTVKHKISIENCKEFHAVLHPVLVGMTYSEVVHIMGGEGHNTQEDALTYDWDYGNGRILRVRFLEWTSSTDGSSSLVVDYYGIIEE